MAKLVFALNQSLDGYVDHEGAVPDPVLFQHFIAHARGLAGSLYGRVMYETMRVWDDDAFAVQPADRDFAMAWRAQPKWVVSRTLQSVGPNAALIQGDLETAVRRLKDEVEGEIEVAGPALAQSVGDLGLIDEYRLYVHPVVLGRGKPYFAGPRPRLRLLAHDRISADVVRLTYIPA